MSYSDVSEDGSSGIAPLLEHTKADVSTASLWASGTVLPFNMPDMNDAVKESPAPTVSSTFTAGVGRKYISPGIKT